MSSAEIQNSDSEIDYEKDIIISEQIVNLLTDVMRKQYCTYLEKLLTKNFETWCNKNVALNEKPPEDWIKKCVQIYEMKAIKSCMIAQFYRKSMLNIMENIRNSTINGKLDKKMKLYSEVSHHVLPNNYYPYSLDAGTQTIKINIHNAITQTSIVPVNEHNKYKINIDKSFTPRIEDEIIKVVKSIKSTDDFIQENKVDTSGYTYENLSLDEKIKLFKNRIYNDKNQSPNKRKRPILSPQKQNLNTITINDKKMKYKLSNSLQTQSSPSFSTCSSSPFEQSTTVDSISKTPKLDYVKEKEIAEPKEDDIAKELDKMFCDEETDFDDIFGLNDTIITDCPNNKPNLKENKLSAQENVKIELKNVISKDIVKQPTNNLRDSIWPCELHMQTKHLREILSEAGNLFGMRLNEKIKIKFIELFGVDDDDDFAPYSPSIEINDILLSSCKARIAPWIVKYLMIPMKDGLIKDRLVFKKFAKRMANKIVTENQYPSELDIKDIIAEYFILHKRIDSFDDIDIT